jgi:asparagine synthase (glutamine-hydrolysing)
MCGIVGFWVSETGLRGEEALPVARRMADTIAHRGPDSDGYWVDADAGITLAHRRLAIQDLSPAGAQPMISASGRYVIIFNGEIYNFQELRRTLEAAGQAPVWRGHSDTEVLLAWIDAWDVETALKRSIGMFAFVLWDRKSRRVILARDRMGEKPLYYGQVRDGFLFGSQLSALKAHPSFDNEIDREATALFLRYAYVPAPFSIYQGIKKLPAGTWLEIEGVAAPIPSPKPYWSFSDVAQSGEQASLDVGEAEATDQLDTILKDVVRSQMVSDVPLGAFLSGGIDSSTIVALMQTQSSRPIRSFSIGFEDEALNEAEYAAAVAQHLGTDHTELYVTEKDALDVAPQLAGVFDEPFSDPSQIPTLLLSRLTREHVTVAMSGDGGDEIFGGYNRYLNAPRLWSKAAQIPMPVRQAVGTMLENLPAPCIWAIQHIIQVLLKKPGKKSDLALASLGHRLRHARTIDDLFVLLMSEWEEPFSLVIGSKECGSLLDDRAAWPRLARPEARMMALDAMTYLPDDIMVKVDRSSMSASLEARVPLLDARVVEFASRLPFEMKISGRTGKRLLRNVLYRYVPPKLIERPKRGFRIPLDEWLRGSLRDWAEDLLSEERLKSEGFFQPQPVRAAWQSLLNGKSDRQFGRRLWSVLMFQSWLSAS